MRVLRTEMYFDTQLVAGLTRAKLENPGVSAAWFAAEPETEIDLAYIVDETWQRFDLQDIPSFVAAALAEFHEIPRFEPIPGRIYMNATAESFAQYILNQTIVIEQSPPEAVPFGGLLKKASSAFIGTYVGMKIAGDASLLLIVTVPGGIIVVSSAIGISKALEKGFNKLVSQAFKKKKT